MAADYNHRVHLSSADMPSMHICDVANGFNMMGYYMYHGGNNPHSTMWTNDRDAPNTTLQESSFQPAGAPNPMPSESYDFFAPLGEFGQPRVHYHQMRRSVIYFFKTRSCLSFVFWFVLRGDVLGQAAPAPPEFWRGGSVNH